MSSAERPRVALFVTCLVDLFRPSVGFAAVKLLEDAGCVVEVPAGQTCCGQPAYNQGDRKDTVRIAQEDDRRPERLRLRRRAVGLLRRHAEEALPGAVPRRLRGRRAGADDRRADVRADQLSDRRARRGQDRGEPAGSRHLSRFLLEPARARRPPPAAPAARERCRPGARRAAGRRGLLRLRRHLLRQISGDLDQDGRRQAARDREHRRRRWCWRPTSAA